MKHFGIIPALLFTTLSSVFAFEDADVGKTVIIELGSLQIKVGFATESTPRVILPTILGRPRASSIREGIEFDREVYVGTDAYIKWPLLTISHPVKNGIIMNWDDLEIIIDSIYKQHLRIPSDKSPVLITENALTSREDREKLMKLFFDKFDVPNYYVANTSLLSMKAMNMTTGLVIRSSEYHTDIVPVIDGKIFTPAVRKMELGDTDITNQMISLLIKNKKKSFDNRMDSMIADDLTTRLGYVALNYERELKRAKLTKEVIEAYELPGGSVEINSERFQCTEILFDPTIIKKEIDGIHKQTNDAISACARKQRNLLYSNIILSGRYAMFDGFSARMDSTLLPLLSKSAKISVTRPPENMRNSVVWTGGIALASTENFREISVSRAEYANSGASIVHEKCVKESDE